MSQGSPSNYHRRRALEHRVQQLLTRLRLLSEAESTSIVHFNKGAGKPSSKAPKGAFRGKGPDPDEGLLIWFLHRLDRDRGSDATLGALCAEAEVRLEKRLKRQPGREAGSAFEGVRETAVERDRRIAEDYVGLEPVEVRAIESERSGFVSEANVRLVRIRARRNPEDGSRQEEVPDSQVEREALARRLKRENPALTLEDLAGRFSVSKMTVSRWLRKSNGGSKAA